jgi:hypothetical protein
MSRQKNGRQKNGLCIFMVLLVIILSTNSGMVLAGSWFGVAAISGGSIWLRVMLAVASFVH